MAILVVIPIMIIMVAFSFTQYFNERSIIENQLEQNTIQLGDLLLGSVQNGMMNNDQEMLRASLTGITQNKSISRIWIINPEGEVKISNIPTEENKIWQLTSVGCVQCHSIPVPDRPRVIINVTGHDELMRVSTPIANHPECWACHSPDQKLLGVLLIDAPLPVAEKNILNDLGRNLILTLTFSLLIGLAAYILMNRMIVLRIENLHALLQTYSSGDFKKRVPDDGRKHDEITILGRTFNHMADQLEERARIRETAIVEERERIAREMHDGIAQFLGYILTKTQAAHLFIEKGDSKKADEFMRQIESETQKQAIDVRASILGLKIFSGNTQVFASDIRRYLSQSNLFTGLEIVPEMAEDVEHLVIEPETELQLMRIMQEAISNIRKHSQAHKALISLRYTEDGLIKLAIADDGVGFDMDEINAKDQPHFGLATMRERAESIGGIFEVKSSPQHGTVISVTIKTPEKVQ
jgi:signal transduction histidine kinase